MQSFDHRALDPEQLEWVARWKRTVEAWFEDSSREDMQFVAPTAVSAAVLVEALRDAGYLAQRIGQRIAVKKPSRFRSRRSML